MSQLASQLVLNDSAPSDSTVDIIESACQQACAMIAPSWPLDQSIAVNPHWKRIHLPIRTVAARMATLAEIPVFPPRTYLQEVWKSGRISERDLQRAIAQSSHTHLSTAECIAALTSPLNIKRLPLLIDTLDNDPARFQRLTWRDAITHQVSQTCATYFDHDQADWQPNRRQDLYGFWRESILHDHGIGVLMGLPKLSLALQHLPQTREEVEHWAFKQLGLDRAVFADYLEAVLLTVNGWASWCAYLDWQAKLEGREDHHLRDLLAIRLAWGVLLMESKGLDASQHAVKLIQQRWKNASKNLADAENVLKVDEVWQIALELGYQSALASQLTHTQQHADIAPDIQAAFCIDVRSEPLRRAAESLSPKLQTLGVAGFFGLPIAYTPLAGQSSRPQLPGLLAPAMHVQDRVFHAGDETQPHDSTHTRDAIHARTRNFVLKRQMASMTHHPSSAFSLVESAGALFLGKLYQLVNPQARHRQYLDQQALPKKYRAVTRPYLAELSLDEKVNLGRRALELLALKQGIAPLVLLVGHASQSHNNAHASSLDCGACCGQSGEVNTRALALLLNDQNVRAGLANIGLQIPDHTAFVAALHNTTTQELEGFDLDLLSTAHQAQWTIAHQLFHHAGDMVRATHIQTLPGKTLKQLPSESMRLQALRKRANDGAQTRPEWGLANNAAFVIGPRKLTKSLALDGRVFLHEYDKHSDSDNSLLELLMTAPMVVTHWINWQYHASTCAPQHYGSGNKLLHNVVGGRIGVFEGNGGDLRIGLSQQSLHTGQQWMHEPLRLTVIIAANRNAIERVLDAHATVRHLVQQQWLTLWCYENQFLYQYKHQNWTPVFH